MKAAKVEATPIIEPGRIVEIPVSMLMPDPNQPRTEFPDDELDVLGDDMAGRGCLVPLIVRSDYVIVDGERRWRAALRKKITTLPCLLAPPADEKAPELERLLDQAAINDQRASLGVLDWARLLRRLVDDHKLPVKDLPDLLAARGFKKLSRSYISNLMRLDELPDWAQDLLRAGQLNPSDGKYLLMARPYPPAMEWVHGELKQAHNNRKDGQTLREALFGWDWEDMEALVERAYSETAGAELTATYGNNVPLFKWQNECKGCPNRQKIRRGEYCLDEKCFTVKQESARAALKANGKSEESARRESQKPAKRKVPTRPTVVEPDENGVVILGRLSSNKYHRLEDYDLRFEPAMHCVGCEHNRPASRAKGIQPEPTCFNPPCFAEKQRNGNREEGVAQWLDRRLLPLVKAKLAGNYDLQFQLLAWMALGGPTQTEHEVRVENRLGDKCRRIRRKLALRDPGAVIQAYAGGNLNGEAIAGAGAEAMLADRAHFYAFARHLGIQLTPAIAHLDAEYLALKRKGELVELLHLAGYTDARLDTATADSGQAEDTQFKPIDKLKLDELVTICLSEGVIHAVGVPPDVQALYDHLKPVIDPDADCDLDQEAEEDAGVSGETDEPEADSDV